MKLAQFQVEGARWLAPRRQAALWDQMRLGKTPQALCALPRDEPVVVVPPASVKINWARETNAWRPDYRALVCRASADFRWARRGELVILNPEILPPSDREVANLRARLIGLGSQPGTALQRAAMERRITRLAKVRGTLRAPPDGTILIGDEFHRFKEPRAQRTMRWFEMASMCLQRDGRAWQLTGSPLLNNSDELWVVLQGCGLGTIAFGTRNAYYAAHSVPGAVADGLRKVSLRRMRKDVFPQLPGKRRQPLTVDIDPETATLLDDLARKLRARGFDIDHMTLEMVRQAAADAQLGGPIALVRERLARAKIGAMLDLVADFEEQEIPVVVFSVHRAPIEQLRRRKRWGVITGSESQPERQGTLDAWRDGKLRGVALTTAGGEGIPLARCGDSMVTDAIFVDLAWTPATVNQMEDRIIDVFQPSSGYCYTRLVADHWVERRVDELLGEKQRLEDETVNASAVKRVGSGRAG